jgi:hypothetical protein
LSLSFSYNIFVTAEYLSSSFYPDINSVTKEVISYYYNHDLDLPIFSNVVSLYYYLDINYTDYYRIGYGSDVSSEDLGLLLSDTNGTVILIDMPVFSRNDSFWNIINEHCDIEKKFYSKDRETGYIFDC